MRCNDTQKTTNTTTQKPTQATGDGANGGPGVKQNPLQQVKQNPIQIISKPKPKPKCPPEDTSTVTIAEFDPATEAAVMANAILAATPSFKKPLVSPAALQALAHQTEDHLEGVAAVLEKRPARFEGR